MAKTVNPFIVTGKIASEKYSPTFSKRGKNCFMPLQKKGRRNV